MREKPRVSLVDFEPTLAGHVAPRLFRLVWWTHLDPSKRKRFAKDLFDVIIDGVMEILLAEHGKPVSPAEREIGSKFLKDVVNYKIGGFAKKMPPFKDETFARVAAKIVERRDESEFNRLFATQYRTFRKRIAKLSPSLISAMKIINEEFLIWLKTHPTHTAKIHADAFEQLSGEILASKGFAVEFTGRVKNLSADIMAVRTSDRGIETKYLIECKRYRKSKKVDLHIVNAVIGASCRAKAKHAMLLTTSSFTANAVEALADLEDIRLDLRDGGQITEWLSDYEFSNRGLWLPDGWQDKWRKNEKTRT